MNIKKIGLVTVIIIVFQLAFSFYYSSLSVSLNQSYQKKYTEYQQIKNLNDQFKTDLAVNTSLNQIATASAELAPINKVLNLGTP